MIITDLETAEALDWLYNHSQISHWIEENFDINYFSGEDGVFMEINVKKQDLVFYIKD